MISEEHIKKADWGNYLGLWEQFFPLFQTQVDT